MRTITICNQTTVLTDAQVEEAVKAIQTQITRDVYPIWGLTATLRFLHGPAPAGVEAISLVNTFSEADALGWHSEQTDVPFGQVSVEACLSDGEDWRIPLSHEAVEQLINPYVNLVCITTVKGVLAVVPYEGSDPVEGAAYLINGVPCSNFVTPIWFSDDASVPGSRYDFLRQLTGPFQLSAGGYIAYTTDLKTWQEVQGYRYVQRGQPPRPGTRRWRLASKPLAVMPRK